VADVLIVSLGATGGLRAADAALAESLRRAGATVALARAAPVREWRTYALIELAWARAARAAARAGIAAEAPRAIVYSTTTAALLAPPARAVQAIRFDAPAAGNRPGRHGIWQRPVERRRFAAASLLLPWSEGGLAEAPPTTTPAVVLPVPVTLDQAQGARPLEGGRGLVVTYGANPEKKGLDRVLAAWRRVRREGEELVVAGLDGADEPGIRYVGTLPAPEYRALLAGARVFATAPRREDYGLAQLEALADGCVLATTPAPGPYAALPLARELDPRTVSDDVGAAIRVALDDPSPGYAARAAERLSPFGAAAIDRIVREDVLPRLLG
jgi:glycosyltransferase involved in cell wall biosynthesis